MKYFLKYSILLFVFLTVCQKDNTVVLHGKDNWGIKRLTHRYQNPDIAGLPNNKNMNKNTSLICFNTTFINTNLSDDFLSIFFINGKDGFISGRNGGIYKTTDSAKTWTKLNLQFRLTKDENGGKRRTRATAPGENKGEKENLSTP